MTKELLYKQNIKIEKFHNVLSPKGMKSVLKRTLVLLCINLLFGQKVFSVDYVNQADVKVFVTDYPNQADVKIHFVKYPNRAKWTQNEKKYLFY